MRVNTLGSSVQAQKRKRKAGVHDHSIHYVIIAHARMRTPAEEFEYAFGLVPFEPLCPILVPNRLKKNVLIPSKVILISVQLTDMLD